MEAFTEYLVENGLIPASAAKRLAGRHYVREPIGMIAVANGLLNPVQIDAILDRQRGSRERFGEVAVALGYLSQQQVEMLVRIQGFRTPADMAEALALAGVLSIEDAGRYLGAFLLRDRELADMTFEL